MSLKSFLLNIRMRQKGVGWYGNYNSFQEALTFSNGYNDPLIFEVIKESALKVLNGQAEYEQDGTLFYKKSFNLNFLAALFFAKSMSKNPFFHITDFGGSLGSLYFRHKNVLDNFNDIKWHVVEQEHFVQTGRELFENNTLDFYYTLDELIASDSNTCDLLVLSSVLQYLPNPHEFMEEFIAKGYRFILLDSMPFIRGEKDLIKVQKSKIQSYRSSYPCYLLSEDLLLRQIGTKYKLHFRLNSDLHIYVDGRRLNYQGFLFERL